MASTITLSLFLAFVFVGMMLALVMGYLSTEERRAREKNSGEAQVLPAVEAVAAMPHFFPTADATEVLSAPAVFDERLLVHLENHVRAERTMVSQFLHDPSIDALYRHASSIHVR